MELRATALLAFVMAVPAQLFADAPPPPIRSEALVADLEFLASDALRGRGSATPDELVAATYVASRLRALGVPPAGENGAYLQTVEVRKPLAGEARVSVTTGKGERPLSFVHGDGVLFVLGSEIPAEGPLVRIGKGNEGSARAGSIVLLGPDAAVPGASSRILKAGAAAVLIASVPAHARFWSERRGQPLALPARRADAVARPGQVVLLSAETTRALESVPEGARVRVEVSVRDTAPGYTWNVLGRIPAATSAKTTTASETIILSAHIDHLGVKTTQAPNEDGVFNGADDDASGVAAVLALAEGLLVHRGRRDVLLAFFGSEELGGLGSEHFVLHPPVPLDLMVAALQLEMLGRPDPLLGSGRLWLTGYDKSDLGEALAQHGAPLVGDPRPEQGFYERSDNYRLAQAGVVAHTVSSFGLHDDYHGPDDEVARIDFAHLLASVRALVPAVRWLVDAPFTPRFRKGARP
jgi:hypothetical protein